MKTSEKGLSLIKRFEGLRLKSYLCPAGVPTIGYGHTGMVKLGETITKEQAEALLEFDLEYFEAAIDELELNLNQNQFDALVAFTYNVGEGNLKSSTLLKKARINPNDITIKDQFLRWNKARKNGKLEILQGLTNRRIAESELYFETI